MILLAPTGMAVTDSDLCLVTPVNQCQGGQLQELGSTDANTDGKDYEFRGSISNADGTGNVTLQYKGDSSTTFNDVGKVFYGGPDNPSVNYWGSSSETVFPDGNLETFEVGEGNSRTVTVNGNEHTIEIYSGSTGVYFQENQIAYFLDAQDLTERNVGEFFTIEDEPVQVYDIYHAGEEYTQNDGETITVGNTDIYFDSVTDNDDTIYAEIDNDPRNFDEGDELGLNNGNTLVLAEVIPTGSGTGQITWEDPDDGPEKAVFASAGDVTSQEGWNEYRLHWSGTDGSEAWSDSLFFAVDRSENLPYDRWVEVEKTRVSNPEITSGITPNSGISAKIFQEESDPVNITLVNADTGTAVSTISTGESGAFFTIYNDLKNSVVTTFTDTSANQTFEFSTLNSDLLSQQGTEYSFYFEIKQTTTPSYTRKTKTYTVETSGTATNPAPQVQSVEAEVDGLWKPVEQVEFGDSIERIRAEITDSNNEFLTADLRLRNNYDDKSMLPGLSDPDASVSYNERSGDYYIWNNGFPVNVTESGEWGVEVNASDGAKNTLETRSWSYPFGQPDISISLPGSVQRFDVFDVSLTVSCSEYECINENESVSSYLDPVEVLS
jgi:hypothetical protein